MFLKISCHALQVMCEATTLCTGVKNQSKSVIFNISTIIYDTEIVFEQIFNKL